MTIQKIIISVILTAFLSWVAWMTTTTLGATPLETFSQHVSNVNKKMSKQQDRIMDKLDKIKDLILNLHSKDK